MYFELENRWKLNCFRFLTTFYFRFYSSFGVTKQVVGKRKRFEIRIKKTEIKSIGAGGFDWGGRG